MLVADYIDAYNKKVSGNQLSYILRFLVGYTRYHFSAEEAFMKQIGYPLLEEHRIIHDQLIEKVTRILLDLKEGKVIDAKTIGEFLTDWVKNHIMNEDKKIGEFFREEKSSAHESSNCECDEKKPLIQRIEKIKDLFAKKLISSEDFKEQKIKIISSHFESRGIKKLINFLEDLEFLQRSNLISEEEKESVLQHVLSSVKLSDALNSVGEIEQKLLIIRTYQDLDLIDDEEIASKKAAILKEI
ncbi:MAG: hypothetical protein Kow0029_17100 [Candidatus Rifleibacteriota bacterium]